MGALRYHDKKRINFVIKKGNVDVFYEQIKSLNIYLLQEWIEQGNTVENFQNSSAKIVIILDNASFHKRKDILTHIEAEMPNIILEFLPPYSPDYNLIELVWHSAKEYIPLLSLSGRTIARSLTRQSIQAILLEKMGLVFVIRKESRDRLLYKSSRIQKWQMFSESDRRGI